MNKDSRPIEQIFPFACRFGTFGRRYKRKNQLSHHMKGHRGCPSKQRKSYTLCQKWISYNMKKKH